MLTIDIPSARYELPRSWDGKSKKLITVPPIHLEMEHSLLSISKWEAIWKIPFLELQALTTDQFLDYCRCMTINRQKDPGVYRFIRQVDADRINAYMEDSMSARKIKPSRNGKRGSRRIMTSEYFYFLMIQYGIPFDCEKWHFGRLLALIDCCQANSSDGPTMSYKDRQKYYNDLNKQRRALLGTKG